MIYKAAQRELPETDMQSVLTCIGNVVISSIDSVPVSISIESEASGTVSNKRKSDSPIQREIVRYLRNNEFLCFKIGKEVSELLLGGFEGFKGAVYNACFEIKPGETTTYGFIAKAAGSAKAARAAGNALSSNPFPLLIPCHRVVLSSGEAGSYIWGSNIKKRLLCLEKDVNSGLSFIRDRESEPIGTNAS